MESEEFFEKIQIRKVPKDLKDKIIEIARYKDCSITKIVSIAINNIIEDYSDIKECEKSVINIQHLNKHKKTELSNISKKLGVNMSALIILELDQIARRKNPTRP